MHYIKDKSLVKINIIISTILLIGFLLTGILCSHMNYRDAIKSIEQVSALTSEGIYFQITNLFTKPINISLTMANDSFLINHLLVEPADGSDEAYIEKISNYLDRYQKKYGFDSAFLVSAATSCYYNFQGMDRILTPGNEENVWYYNFMESAEDYSLNVDNDEVSGANNEITVFINCKIKNADNSVLGVVGLGIRIDSLKELFEKYEEMYGLEVSLIDKRGTIQVSTTHTGYEETDWFELHNLESVRSEIISWQEDMEALKLWVRNHTGGEKDYIVAHYIDELSWTLVIEQSTGELLAEVRSQVSITMVILVTVIFLVIFIVTSLVRGYNHRIMLLTAEKQTLFEKATAKLYDNIYEINLTENAPVGKKTCEYFESLTGKVLPYSETLPIIVKTQVKREYREGYRRMFSPENVLKEYENGKDHLQYDFLFSSDGENYNWFRIDARLFYSQEDRSVHMFVYHKNIDREKEQERIARTDQMTGFYNRITTEQKINEEILSGGGRSYALFVFDIDNFKQANDRFGHAFGDFCIQTFTAVIRQHFDRKDILGRIGGDEFAVFAFLQDREAVQQKARELSKSLSRICAKGDARWEMTASIGVVFSSEADTDFEALYKIADKMLYQAKENGRNGFVIYP